MVNYTYNINADGPISTLQGAIDAIALDLLDFPKIEDDITVNVGQGVYAGFTIPNGALMPLLGTPYRVIIRAGGKYFPVIDFNQSPDGQYVGIDIGSANPNVTIIGLRVQFFSIGVRAGINSHGIKVQNCILSNNRNAGIFYEQSNRAQAIQNVIVNGSYGIVVRLCKDSALLHNTIFLNGSISNDTGKALSAIWASMGPDYGSGSTDSGKLHMIGNIAWNTSGPCVTLFHSDLENRAIVSNWNNFTLSSKDYIVLEDKVFVKGNSTIPRRVYSTLTEWKATGNDTNSRSDDPKFIQPVKLKKGKNGLVIDLTILPSSPVLKLVPSFYVEPTLTSTWLPSYVDAQDLSKDILGNPRLRDGTAAGCNEKASSAGFFGMDVTTSPLDLGLTKECDIDPFNDIIYKKLDIIFPKIKTGYFYSYEREYYLYSKKECKYIGELAHTSFELPAQPVSTLPMNVYVRGVKITDFSYIDIRGRQLVLRHKDLDISDGNETIELQCWIQVWKDNGFSYQNTHYRFKINEGRTRFFLPEKYVPKGPVVITDDVTNFGDYQKYSNREFSVVFDEEENRSEIKFHNYSNKFYNAQFDQKLTSSGNPVPTSWASVNTIVSTGEYPHYQVVGDYVAKVYPAGYIKQRVEVNTGNSALSWHSCAKDINGTNTPFCDLTFYDINNNALNYTITNSFTPEETWKRYYITLGKESNYFNTVTGFDTMPIEHIGHFQIPNKSKYVDIAFRTQDDTFVSNGYIAYDALQFEHTDVPSFYNRKFRFNELTVEYETSDTDFYIDTRQAIAPTRNLINQGFLYIPEISAALYNGPTDGLVTTLFDWRWPEGRKGILPWARTVGKDKLRKRVDNLFHDSPQRTKSLAVPVHGTAYPFELSITPEEPTCSQLCTNGVGISIQCLGTDGNPYSLGIFYAYIRDLNQKFPGYLSKKVYGIKEQLGPSAYGQLNNAGVACITWLPPEENQILYVGSVPSKRYTKGGSILSSIELPYPCNLTNHGNIIILNSSDRIIPTKDLYPSVGVYSASYSRNTSVVQLEFPIVPGTIRVFIEGTEYTEIPTNNPDSNQFYVDYIRSIIYLKGKVKETYIEYVKSFITVNEANPYRILFYHDKVFGTYTGPITIGYDATVKLEVHIQYPDSNSYFTRSFNLVAQNSLSTRDSTINTSALEL